mgnify:CR=1 FL=1
MPGSYGSFEMLNSLKSEPRELHVCILQCRDSPRGSAGIWQAASIFIDCSVIASTTASDLPTYPYLPTLPRIRSNRAELPTYHVPPLPLRATYLEKERNAVKYVKRL